jgi:hypothetical protein
MNHLNDALIEFEENPNLAKERIEFIRQLAFEKLGNIIIEDDELESILERSRVRVIKNNI